MILDYVYISNLLFLVLQVHALVRLSQQSISLAYVDFSYSYILVYGVYFGLECQLTSTSN